MGQGDRICVGATALADADLMELKHPITRGIIRNWYADFSLGKILPAKDRIIIIIIINIINMIICFSCKMQGERIEVANNGNSHSQK